MLIYRTATFISKIEILMAANKEKTMPICRMIIGRKGAKGRQARFHPMAVKSKVVYLEQGPLMLL